MFGFVKKIKRAIEVFFPTKRSIGGAGINSYIEFPVYMATPKMVFMEKDARLRQGAKLLNSGTDKILIKKYTVVGMNCMIITNNHTSTVGIPEILLGISGINDKHSDITIEEDVWVGSNVTILPGANLGRGCICGACSTITKPVPPYALVVGSPAKIVGVKFTIDQIIEHEKVLYTENERYSREYLERLFSEYYSGLKVYGVSTKFTQDNIERLQYCTKARNFTKKDYFEKIKTLCE